MRYAEFIRQMVAENGRPREYSRHVYKQGYDKHHIRPIWMFPDKRQSVEGNHFSNLVWLTRDQHVHAHMLLALETDAYEDWQSLSSAAFMDRVSPDVTRMAEVELNRRGRQILKGIIQPENRALDLSPLPLI